MTSPSFYHKVTRRIAIYTEFSIAKLSIGSAY